MSTSLVTLPITTHKSWHMLQAFPGRGYLQTPIGNPLGSLSLDINPDAPSPVSGDMSFTLNPGDVFTLYAYLNADTSSWGAESDAYHSLTMDVDHPEMLAPQRWAVPVPASAWLLGSGLAYLVSLVRKKKGKVFPS